MIFAATVAGDTDSLYTDDPYQHLLVQTLADRLAEAATEKMHEYIRKNAWGYAPNETLSIAELLQEKFQGIRPAVGYPSLPDQSVNFLIDRVFFHCEPLRFNASSIILVDELKAQPQNGPIRTTSA